MSAALIVGAFVAELVVKLAVARNRLAYLKENWPDVLIVAVPFLRPLRILRVLRVLPFVVRGAGGYARSSGGTAACTSPSWACCPCL